MIHTGADLAKCKKHRIFLFSMLIPICFSLFILNSCDVFFHDMAKLSDTNASAGGFTVIFDALNDSPNTSIVVEAGSTIAEPDNPTALSTVSGTFTFVSWWSGS